MQNYKELVLWKDAHLLTMGVYRFSSAFPKEEVYGLTSQLRRAVVSISCNIAEGCGRHTSKDFANFLQIAMGSVNETDYLLLLAKDLNYLPQENFDEIQLLINRIRTMTIKLLQRVRANPQ